MEKNLILKNEIRKLKQKVSDLKKQVSISSTFINAVDYPFFLINGSGIIIVANKTASKKYSISQEDINKIPIWDRLLPDTAAEWQKEITMVIQKNKPGRFQIDDKERVQELIIWPAFNRPGKIEYFALMEKDITQNIRALENLNLFKEQEHCSTDQMLHASKMINLGTLIAGITHEINNPNSFILTNAPLLEKIWNDLSENIGDYLCENDILAGGMEPSEIKSTIPSLLKGINVGSQRIDRIVKSLKSFSRPDNNKSFEPVCLNDVIKNSLLFINNEISKATKNFNTELDKNLPCIAGIRQRLEQIVVNLLLNACQALTSHDQAITISTYSRDNKIYIMVKDKGSGIKNSDMKNILDPFFTTRAGFKGTGLGLSITDKIVKEHSGILEFTSKPGKGTCVTVGFPKMGAN